MKVALLSMYTFDEVRGGTEIFMEHLRRAFSDLHIITYSSTGSKSIDLSRFNLEEAKKGLAVSREFLRRHRREDFDLVISNSTAGWYLGLARPQLPMLNVYHFTLQGLADQVLRGTKGYYPSKYFCPLFEKMSSVGKGSVAVSSKVARELWSDYHIRSTVIEHGIPMERFRPLSKEASRAEIGLSWDGPVGLFVGRADSTKGFDVLKAVVRRRPDIRFLCVTQSDLEDPELEVHRRVENDRMPLYYSAADFLLFPSRYESVGYAALEAMACDLPAVVSRTGVFEDMEEGPIGRIVPSCEPEDFVEAIDQVLSGPTLHPRAAIGKRYGMERFLDDYRAAAREAVSNYNEGRKKEAPAALLRT